MIVFAFYCALHITQLSLHNALSLRNEYQMRLHHHEGMTKCPLITFSILFGCMVIVALTMVVLNSTQLSFWNSWMLFSIVHLQSLDKFMAVILYGSCAVAQAFKIRNFFGEKERNYLKPLAWIGFFLSLAMFCLLITHIVLIIWYPGKEVIAAI
jgi:hypothetical protein